MLKSTLTHLGFFIFSCSAFGVSVIPSKTQSLVLESAQCSDLISEHKSICHWKKSLEPEFVIPEITEESCIKRQKMFRMTIQACLPKFVAENVNKKNYQHGSNCWGTALSFKSYSLKPRYVWSEEMDYWLNSPVCRKLDEHEPLEMGDLINTYGPEYIFEKTTGLSRGEKFWESFYPGRLLIASELGYTGFENFFHSETYLTPELSFGKNSPAKDDLFEFHQTSEIYARPRDKKCQELQSKSPYFRENPNTPVDNRKNECLYYSLAYRCQNFEDYFSKISLSEREKEILKTIRELQLIQAELFKLQMINKYQLSHDQISQFLMISDQESDLTEVALTKEHEMLIVWKYFTASGIRKSLELAKKTDASENI